MVHAPSPRKAKNKPVQDMPHCDKVGYRLQSYSGPPVNLRFTSLNAGLTPQNPGSNSPNNGPNSPNHGTNSPSHILNCPDYPSPRTAHSLPGSPLSRTVSPDYWICPATPKRLPPGSPVASGHLSPSMMCRPHPCQAKLPLNSMGRIRSPTLSNQAYEYVSTS